MSKAVIKYLRLSPTKARLIARQIQGMNAELAMASLKFMPNKGAKFIASAISSAVANGGFEANEVEVVSCRVDAGAVLKRFQPRARGSASRIRKPSSHILVVVEKTEEKAKKPTQNSSKATNEAKNSSSKAKNSSQNSTKVSENSSKAVNSKENSNKAVNSSEKKAENSNKNVNSSEAENSTKAVSEDKKAENSSSENSKTAKGEAKKAPARAKKSETKED